MESEINNKEDKFQSLLEEFTKVRDSIYKMIEDVEVISANVKDLFPEKFDARYRMIFQERVKATTEIFKTLLDMKKEITKNIKDEIDIRRKIQSGDKFEQIEELINMSDMMDKIEEFESKIKKTVKKTKTKPKKVVEAAEELNLKNIDIPSIEELDLGNIVDDTIEISKEGT